MLASPEFIYFVIASILITLAPGPDIIFLITQSINYGSKSGVITALGLASGNLIHTAAAALGISIIFQTSATAFHALKIAGVVYLLFLAYSSLKQSQAIDSKPTIRLTGIKLYLRGILMNALNPKVALFYVAYLPQFVIENSLPAWQQMVFYGVIFTALVVIIFGSIGLTAGYAEKFFNQKNSHWLHWLTAMVFISLAVNLVCL